MQNGLRAIQKQNEDSNFKYLQFKVFFSLTNHKSKDQLQHLDLDVCLNLPSLIPDACKRD